MLRDCGVLQALVQLLLVARIQCGGSDGQTDWKLENCPNADITEFTLGEYGYRFYVLFSGTFLWRDFCGTLCRRLLPCVVPHD